MAMHVTSHHETHFDSLTYIDINYRDFEPHNSAKVQHQMRGFIIESLCKIYEDGSVKGEKLLDIGCGPLCYSPLPACPWIKEITLCDNSPENISILQQWKDGKNVHQENVLRYIATLDNGNSAKDWKKLDYMLLSKVAAITLGDMRKEVPLGFTELKHSTFDIVTAILSINAASLSEDEYSQNLRNVSHHLKKGGYLIVADTIEKPHYTVGTTTFTVAELKKETIKDLLVKNGFTIRKWFQTKLAEDGVRFNCFCVLLQKN